MRVPVGSGRSPASACRVTVTTHHDPRPGINLPLPRRYALHESNGLFNQVVAGCFLRGTPRQRAPDITSQSARASESSPGNGGWPRDRDVPDQEARQLVQGHCGAQQHEVMQARIALRGHPRADPPRRPAGRGRPRPLSTYPRRPMPGMTVVGRQTPPGWTAPPRCRRHCRSPRRTGCQPSRHRASPEISRRASGAWKTSASCRSRVPAGPPTQAISPGAHSRPPG